MTSIQLGPLKSVTAGERAHEAHLAVSVLAVPLTCALINNPNETQSATKKKKTTERQIQK